MEEKRANVTRNCETLWPNHMLVHKNGALFKVKGQLKFEAHSYTIHHPLSADHAIIIFKIS